MSMSSSRTFRIKQGDTAPILSIVPLDQDGEAIPLAAATSVTFTMKLPDGPAIVDEAAADISLGAGPDGEDLLEYEWQPGDTDQDGILDGEFEVTWSDGTKTTFPNFSYIQIIIKEQLA